MNEMSAVPANSGTAPKEPDEPTWSARIAICGLHVVPNRKSIGEIIEKKRNASNATEATMPIVVNTAIVEQPISSHSITRSTRLRARSSGVMRARTAITVPMAITMTSTVSAMRLMPRRCRYSADAARTASLTDRRRNVARDEIAHVVHDQRQIVRREIADSRRQVIGDQPQDDGVLEHQPHADDRERRQRAPHRRHQSVMTGERMQVAHAARAADQRERTRLADPERADRQQCERDE